jgi:hypothetical protein
MCPHAKIESGLAKIVLQMVGEGVVAGQYQFTSHARCSSHND